ncbi:MAG: YbaN family protein [Burkholderiales bacterium]|nr:YbaN family protein [Burkholderiales bacterium]
MKRALALVMWRALALASAALGFIGVFVPGLPTVPFLLLAAWAGGRGWPALEAWLLDHPKHGAAIRRWRERRAIARRAKWFASATMAVSVALIAVSAAPPALQIGVTLIVATVALWLWSRPEA